MKVIKDADVPRRKHGYGVVLKILLDKQEGANNLDVGIIEIAGCSKTPTHKRDFEEVIYMLEGSGSVVLETGEDFLLNKGDCMLIPPFVAHFHANKDVRPLKQLYIFAPQSGDEIQQELRDKKIIEE